MDIKALAQRLHDYILKVQSVTMTELYTLGVGKYTRNNITQALVLIHKMKDITKKMKGGDVVYCVPVVKEKKLPSERELEQKRINQEYFDRLDKEYEEQCAKLTPEQSAYADSVFEGVAEFELVGNSWVPKSNVEHYKKVLGQSRRPKTRR